MPMVPTGIARQTDLASQIRKAIRKLGKDVVRVNYSFGSDSTGEDAIFFRLLLTDAASREGHIAHVMRRITTTLYDELHPQENWGLLPYFTFRGKSEQEELNDPDWA